MLSTKIHPPRHRGDLLVRARLFGALADGGARLVLVTGPAGSGKTVLVRQWLDRVDHPCAWLTVDPRDNDPARFWAYFAGAVSALLPEFCWSADEQVTAELLETLADRLGAAAPLVLVIDDLHFLVDDEVLAQLGQLLQILPEGVRLVLVSRGVPQLQLARYRAAGELVEVRGRDLLFTTEETGRVLGRPEDDPLAAEVHDSTGGWPVAVGFAALLPKPRPGGAAVSRPTARTRQQIADYLTEEVLLAQPEGVQEFLLDTSILDEITVAAADAVRGAQDAAQHLDYLERHDVFLSALDGTGVETWRHHALVRDHLRGTLQRAWPERWSDLQVRAARHYAPSDPERAIGHALTAPDPDLAADLIEAGMVGPSGLYSRLSRWQLLRWFEALPDHILSQRDALRSSGLALAASTGRADLVDRWIAARPPGTVVALEELFTEAWRADTVGDMPRCRDACRRALPMCEPGSVWWHTIHGGLADAEYMTGNWDAAAESFVANHRPVTHLQVRESGVNQEMLRAFPVVIRCRQGDQAAAAVALGELRDWLGEVAGLGHRSRGATAWAEAMVAFYAGDTTAAARWDTLPEASELGEQPLQFLVFRLDLARVRRAAGDTGRAAELLAEVRRRLAGYVDPGRFPDWVAAEEDALGSTAPSRPDGAAVTGSTEPSEPIPAFTEPLSQREREVLRLLRSEFSLPEIAAHLFVSYNTAKTHRRTIYLKLGVSSRSAAVARGRALGYL